MVSWFMDMLTMRPRPEAMRAGTAARAIRNGPLTLVSTMSRQTAGPTSQNRVGVVRKSSLTRRMPRPALLTRTSSRPKRATATSTAAAQSSSRVTSARTGTIASSEASAATASTSARLRAEVAITRAPAAAKPSAMARPRPRPAPVMMATRPARACFGSLMDSTSPNALGPGGIAAAAFSARGSAAQVSIGHRPAMRGQPAGAGAFCWA